MPRRQILVYGYTDDLRARVARHNSGTGARTTARKENWNLIYYEACLTKADAVGREKFLKSGSGRNYLKKQLRNYLNSKKLSIALELELAWLQCLVF